VDTKKLVKSDNTKKSESQSKTGASDGLGDAMLKGLNSADEVSKTLKNTKDTKVDVSEKESKIKSDQTKIQFDPKNLRPAEELMTKDPVEGSTAADIKKIIGELQAYSLVNSVRTKLDTDLADASRRSKPKALTATEINDVLETNQFDTAVALVDKRLVWLRQALHTVGGYYMWAMAELKRGYMVTTTTTTETQEIAKQVQRTFKDIMAAQKEMLDIIVSQYDKLSPLVTSVSSVTKPLKTAITSIISRKEQVTKALGTMFKASQDIMYDALSCGPDLMGQTLKDGSDMKEPAATVMPKPDGWGKNDPEMPFPFISDIVQKCEKANPAMKTNGQLAKSFCMAYMGPIIGCHMADLDGCSKAGTDASTGAQKAFSKTFDAMTVIEDSPELKKAGEKELTNDELKCPNYLQAKMGQLKLRHTLQTVTATLRALLTEYSNALSE
jgi:hypothetical protein